MQQCRTCDLVSPPAIATMLEVTMCSFIVVTGISWDTDDGSKIVSSVVMICCSEIKDSVPIYYCAGLRNWSQNIRAAVCVAGVKFGEW